MPKPSNRLTRARRKKIFRPADASLAAAGDAQCSGPLANPFLARNSLFGWIVALLLLFFAAGYFMGFNSAPRPAEQLSEQQTLQLLADQKFGSQVNIVSVTSDGKGSLNQADVEISPGSGRVLFSINPFVEPDTQNSVKTAARVAEKFTGKSLAGKDLVVTVENTPAQLIGGPSAGAAIAVATIAAIEKKVVRTDAAITGTINPDGAIGQIGGVIEKALAAADQNLSLFIVPRGQKSFTYYEQVQEQSQRGPFTIIRTRYVPKTIDLQAALEKDGYKLMVVEAEDINAAVGLMVENRVP